MRATPVLLALLFSARAQAGSVTGQLQLTDKGGKPASDLSDAVVYLEAAKPVKPKPGAPTVVMMKAKAFTPHVVVVPVGGTVEFPNDDPIFHNAFSVSPENKFDLELYKRPKTGSWTFKTPGVVNVYCNIHPQMSAVVVVRDNPYYAKVAKDGTFSIEGVPAGKYTFVAWHERGGDKAVEISVPAEGAATTNVTLDGSKYKRVQHKNKFGKDYSTGERY